MSSKELSLRIVEAFDVRKQLTKLGFFMDAKNGVKFIEASNSFVRDGISSCLRLKITPESVVVIKLNAQPLTQSGVILEYM